jgi:hypothetical protein
VEKVKRGRIVAVRYPKTIEVLELRVGYIKGRFGLSRHEEIKDAKAWDGDVVEPQLAHLYNSTEGLYKKHGPLALIGSRTKLMQHWADRVDRWLNPKVMSIKRGTQA